MRVLKIESLPSVKEVSWIDKDYIMLHACFQLLKDCVEKENVDTHCDYESHKQEVDEIRFLYKWWEERSTDVESRDEDNEMLSRLIAIRNFLWT